MRDLNGQVAVVTGAGSGIGRAMALRFAAEGMQVALADIEDRPLEQTRELIGQAARARPTDVGDEAAVRGLADWAFDTFGAVHVLCNNAGVCAGGRMWTRPAADFEWNLRVNLWGVLHGIRAFVPRMIAQAGPGHIVNTCSAAALFPAPLLGPYMISKYAAFAASLCLAHELQLSASKLRVSALCPGSVATRIHQAERNRPPKLATAPTADSRFADQKIIDGINRGLAPEDVAAAVVTAIHNEQFLILPTGPLESALREQVEALLTGSLPSLVDFAPPVVQ